MRCPSCACEAPDAQRFCGACGTSLVPPSELPTASSIKTSNEPLSAALTSGLTPGTVLAGRYRISSLLGRGGMGEVYRADDLALGVTVALKFLPAALASDPDRRARFLTEVRLARQVVHPHVCRVFDISEPPDGPPFLTMEYVDGEDVASLLRRIGRLPADTALEVSRQICAGLAAAHAHGVLHRDLKPANVMIDGRGRVRIMDFGIAVSADAADRVEISGTPAYMAPEVLDGGPASFRSDIYSLGLLLYEVHTGRPGYAAASLAEARRRKQQDPPAPSDLVPDIDSVVERGIMQSLARDPGARPASVIQVAAALPGGSPLEAALRAGQTPSPEMVAASTGSGGLTAARAWLLVALVAIGGVAAIALGADALLWRHAAPARSPDALADDARELLVRLGYREPPVDRASGFEVDLDQLRDAQRRNPTGWRTETPDPSFLRFWYRESPRPLEAWRFPFLYGNVSRVTPTDPPHDLAGMRLVGLDPVGRLVKLSVVPSATATEQHSPDWSAILTHAGFDPAAWTSATPQRTPPVFADARAAWVGKWPSNADVPVRLEAAALGGRAVYFEAVYPWTPLPRTPAAFLTAAERAAFLTAILLAAGLTVSTAVVARQNVRAGRGDRRGAFRVATFVFTVMVVSWFFGESHVATLWEITLVVMALSLALLAASLSWVIYLAVEPFLRRRWPEVLVTWTRLVAGEFRDPLVGRDILAGCAAGSLLAAVVMLGFLLPDNVGVASQIIFADVFGLVYGVQGVVPLLTWRAAQSVLAGLGGVWLLLLLRLVCRSDHLAIAAFIVVGAVVFGGGDGDYWLQPLVGITHFGAFAWLIARFGLLAAVVQFYVWGLFVFFPMTADLGAWYAGAGVTALLVIAALTAWGLTAALTRSARAAI